MFEFLEGIITDVRPDSIVINVNGLGFLVYTPDPYKFDIGSDTQRIYVYQAVSENSNLLYGFHDSEDKRLFLKLIAVSGIGPKSALAILAGNDRKGLVTAITNEDVKFLTKFPGVGKKTAQQIILDLQGKLGELSLETDLFSSPNISQQAEVTSEVNDALAALMALGYTEKQVNKIKDDLVQQTGLSTDEYLSLGLKLLMK